MSLVPADQLSARSLRAVLFDLDGTLLDTVADISVALNRALAEQKFASLPAAQVRVLIGRGVPTLIERALARLGAAAESSDAARLVERFQFHYERIHELGEIQTRVYPGVTAGLAELHALGLGLAVVTNKPKKRPLTC
jgi:phosphoglycolate phosphatase